MKENDFKEKIALVRIKDGGQPFGSFFGVKKFPVAFVLDVNVDLLNVKSDYKYYIAMNITPSSTISNIASHEIVPFIISKEDMIFVNDNYGQSFITAKLGLNVDKSDSFAIEISLLDSDRKMLSSHSTYFYFGESE